MKHLTILSYLLMGMLIAHSQNPIRSPQINWGDVEIDHDKAFRDSGADIGYFMDMQSQAPGSRFLALFRNETGLESIRYIHIYYHIPVIDVEKAIFLDSGWLTMDRKLIEDLHQQIESAASKIIIEQSEDKIKDMFSFDNRGLIVEWRDAKCIKKNVDRNDVKSLVACFQLYVFFLEVIQPYVISRLDDIHEPLTRDLKSQLLNDGHFRPLQRKY